MSPSSNAAAAAANTAAAICRSFGSGSDGRAMTVCLDFFLSPDEAKEEGESEPKMLIQSPYLSVSIVKSQYFQITTAENSWSLPPSGMKKGAWHSIAVSTLGSGVPAVVVDGNLIAGGVQDSEKLQNLSPSKGAPAEEEEDAKEEEGGGEEKKDNGVDYSASLLNPGSGPLAIKNLGVWAATLTVDELKVCSSAYASLRDEEAKCQERTDAILAEYEANAQKVRDDWEAAEEKVGKEVRREGAFSGHCCQLRHDFLHKKCSSQPDVIGAIGEQPEVKERCDMVKEFVGQVTEGESVFKRLILPTRIEKGMYAWVVEDVGGISEEIEDYVSPFPQLSGGSCIMAVA